MADRSQVGSHKTSSLAEKARLCSLAAIILYTKSLNQNMLSFSYDRALPIMTPYPIQFYLPDMSTIKALWTRRQNAGIINGEQNEAKTVGHVYVGEW